MADAIEVIVDGKPITNWILSAAGNVYLCSSIGSACTFEDEWHSNDYDSHYLDSLDCELADPAIRDAVLQALRGAR